MQDNATFTFIMFLGQPDIQMMKSLSVFWQSKLTYVVNY